MSRFRTVRLSDPRHERNHLRYIVVKSSHLRGRGDICLYIPPNTDRTDLPIVVLLHGVYGSSMSWAQAAGAHHTAHASISSGEIEPMILAMPSDGLWGDGSGYVPHATLDFERWITNDVLDVVQEHIKEAKDTTDIFISGLSMGGYGALRLGAKYGHRFKAISAHSSITDIVQMEQFIEEPINKFRPDAGEENVFNVVSAHKENLPPLRFDCGTEDLLIDANRLLHQQLTQASIIHTYEEFEGAHEWSYWERHLIDSLLFFNSYL